MFSKNLTRREFFTYGQLLFFFILSSCSNISKNVSIAIQSSLYPNSLKKTIPNYWLIENIKSFEKEPKKNLNKILNSDFTLINDGWLNFINFNEFNSLNEELFFNKLDNRSKNFLKSFEENQRNKLFPIGVVPYAIILKNKKEFINLAKQSWDFLLSSQLTNKIIFPKSPRLLISISEKIKSSNSLAKLKKQAMLFDDQNMLNWLINSDACVAIVPYSLCSKYFKIDPRLSVVFPEQGVPLMWHFLLSRSNFKKGELTTWIQSYEKKSIVDKLSTQGWYLPFENDYIQSKYNPEISEISGPSKECWDKSWSFPNLTNIQKMNLENYWNNLLAP